MAWVSRMLKNDLRNADTRNKYARGYLRGRATNHSTDEMQGTTHPEMHWLSCGVRIIGKLTMSREREIANWSARFLASLSNSWRITTVFRQSPRQQQMSDLTGYCEKFLMNTLRPVRARISTPKDSEITQPHQGINEKDQYECRRRTRYEMIKSCFVTFATLTTTFIASPSLANADIYEGINHLRMNQCSTDASKTLPLSTNPDLENAALRRAEGESIGKALTDSSALFSFASVLVVGGDIKTALSRLGSRHCAKLADTGYTDVGAVFAKDRWWIVLGSKDSDSREPAEVASHPAIASDDIGEVLLNTINIARSQARYCGEKLLLAAPPVALNHRLTEAASMHAKDMANRSYFSHSSPEGDSAPERVRAAGYHFRAVGENIAAAPIDSPLLVIEGWLMSPGHCINMMGPQFSEIGMAVARRPGARIGKWVLVFGAHK